MPGCDTNEKNGKSKCSCVISGKECTPKCKCPQSCCNGRKVPTTCGWRRLHFLPVMMNLDTPASGNAFCDEVEGNTLMEVDQTFFVEQSLKRSPGPGAGIGEDTESALSETFSFVELASSSVGGYVAEVDERSVGGMSDVIDFGSNSDACMNSSDNIGEINLRQCYTVFGFLCRLQGTTSLMSWHACKHEK